MQLVTYVELVLLLVIVVAEEVGIRVDFGLELVAPVLAQELVEQLRVEAVHLDALVDRPDGCIVEGYRDSVE